MNLGEHWLNRGRLILYSRFVLAIFLAFSFALVKNSNIVDPKGYAIISDFTLVWVSSDIGLAGHPQDAYDENYQIKGFQNISPADKGKFAWWLYPPTFYLLILPLALFPYWTAYLTYVLATLAGYVVLLRKIIWGKEAIWCFAAFPATWINFLLGQNGFLTAALAGAALLSLPRRPILSGLFVGLLSIKPHLGLLFPVALVAIGAWQTILVAAAVVGVFTALATLVLGSATLDAWVHNLGLAKSVLEAGGAHLWSNMPSIFAFLRLLGASITVAYGFHALVAAMATIVVWRVWRQCSSWPLRGAVLTTATLLTSPYVFSYDLVWLALPIAWMVKLGLKEGWLRWEREVLVIVWLLPLLMAMTIRVAPIQIGPWVLLTLLYVILRRVQLINTAINQKDPI